MTAREIAQYIAALPVGFSATVTFVVEESRVPIASTTRDARAGDDGALVPTAPDAPAEPDALKLKQAKAEFGIPVRELQRAVSGRFLPAEQKKDGRDAGAF